MSAAGCAHYVIIQPLARRWFSRAADIWSLARARPCVVKCRMHVTSFKRSLNHPHGTSQNQGRKFFTFDFPKYWHKSSCQTSKGFSTRQANRQTPRLQPTITVFSTKSQWIKVNSKVSSYKGKSRHNAYFNILNTRFYICKQKTI